MMLRECRSCHTKDVYGYRVNRSGSGRRFVSTMKKVTESSKGLCRDCARATARALNQDRTSVVFFNVAKSTEGGRSFRDAKQDLEVVGVTDIEQAASIYIGQYVIVVPKRFEKRAERVLYGK